MVLLGERVAGIRLDHVAIDNIAASEEAVAHLTDRGRRRIAAICAQARESAQTAHQRLVGYRRALDSAGLPYRSELVCSAPEWRREAGAAATRELLRLPEPPDSILCFNDLLALGALRALFEAGVDVPGDVAVVGFDDIEDGRFSTPSLTTVAPEKPYIARTSIELLAIRLRRHPPPPPPQEITAGHRLIVRESSSVAHVDQ